MLWDVTLGELWAGEPQTEFVLAPTRHHAPGGYPADSVALPCGPVLTYDVQLRATADNQPTETALTWTGGRPPRDGAMAEG